MVWFLNNECNWLHLIMSYSCPLIVFIIIILFDFLYFVFYYYFLNLKINIFFLVYYIFESFNNISLKCNMILDNHLSPTMIVMGI